MAAWNGVICCHGGVENQQNVHFLLANPQVMVGGEKHFNMNAIENEIQAIQELSVLKARLKTTWMTGDYDLFSGFTLGLSTAQLNREHDYGGVSDNQLRVFAHSGFWHPMDNLRDKHFLEDRWASGRAEWKVW